MPKGVVAAAFASLAIAGTVAWAAVETDFFAAVFGDKGHEDVEERSRTVFSWETGEPVFVHDPERTWYQADPAAVETLMAGCTQEVDESVAAGDCTLTLQNLAIDENGLGIAAVAICRPGGFEPGVDFGVGGGELVFSPDSPLRGLGLGRSDGAPVYSRIEIDEATSTPEELRTFIHFDAGAGLEDGTELVWPALENEDVVEDTVAVAPPEKRLRTVRCASEGCGVTVSVSPLGYVVDTGGAAEELRGAMQWYVAFTMADGTQMVAYEEVELEQGFWLGTYNLFLLSQPEDRLSWRGATTFFIDLDRLESVTLRLLQTIPGENGELVPTECIAFYPIG